MKNTTWLDMLEAERQNRTIALQAFEASQQERKDTRLVLWFFGLLPVAVWLAHAIL